jgi:parvulin-like peptidyl-prolyl isomerase
VQQILDNTESFAKVVLDKLVDEEILIQKAAEMGLSVSDAEVEEALQGLFRFFPNGTPTPAPTFPPVSTPTPSQAQLDLLNYTATPETVNPDVAEERQTEGTPTAEETAEVETTATDEAETAAPTATPTLEISATATPYTEEMFQEEYQGYVSDLSAINIEEASLRTYLRSFLLVQKVREQIVSEIPREQEQVWARHILVKTMPEALIVLDRLDKGEDWTSIAADVSLDTSNKDNGGDLGWFASGRMVEPFETAAFALEPGETSDPVETQFGVHLIQVIGKDTLLLSDSEFESLQEIRYQEWFQEIKATAEIKINDVWQELAPKEPTYRVF